MGECVVKIGMLVFSGEVFLGEPSEGRENSHAEVIKEEEGKD